MSINTKLSKYEQKARNSSNTIMAKIKRITKERIKVSIKALKYQITMNPQQSITDLFINDSIFNDIDINNFSRSLGITGRLDYSKYLKYQLIANVRTNYLDRAIIELHQLQRLSLISGRYVKVNKYGFPLKLDSKTVFKLLKKLLNRYKSMKEAKSSYGC